MSLADRAGDPEGGDVPAAGSPEELLGRARATAAALFAGASQGHSLAQGRRAREAHGTVAALLEDVLAGGFPEDPAEGQGPRGRAAELLDLLVRIAEEFAFPRLAAWERIHAALGRLAELGPVSEIVDRAAAEAAAAAGLDRVVLSRVEGGGLLAEVVHLGDGSGEASEVLAALREQPIAIAYPLAEAEILRRRQPLLVEEGGQGRSAYAELMGWRQHVVVPVELEGRVVGVFHGDRTSGDPPLTALDRDALVAFAGGFSQVFERAVLRRRLRTQRQELRKVASWADARTSELSEGAVDLVADREQGEREQPARAPTGRSQLQELLTRREIDVLEQMAGGETNAGIAQALVVSEGTVKFHVKNILRKMQAANRAEATSRYLRTKYGGGGLDGGA